ncbi:hypothetical protein C1645_827929 [Glomus cerebriforme]|uniref:Endonuclease/exonuclease/phosphatase n=1 Tax=Glomus cerebriforme TaxID=658196 RepID=A0A397SMJ1_9GLOM|nr:hypothetical protein C1645_827929 [Glomus cerebriforme]
MEIILKLNNKTSEEEVTTMLGNNLNYKRRRLDQIWILCDVGQYFTHAMQLELNYINTDHKIVMITLDHEQLFLKEKSNAYNRQNRPKRIKWRFDKMTNEKWDEFTQNTDRLYDEYFKGYN